MTSKRSVKAEGTVNGGRPRELPRPLEGTERAQWCTPLVKAHSWARKDLSRGTAGGRPRGAGVRWGGV